MKVSKRAGRGMSMLELLITVFVVIMGLLVVVTAFVAVAKSNRYSERMDTANTLMRLEMERMRNQSYAAIQSETGAYGEFPEYPDYRHTTTVRDLVTVKEVKVDILFEHYRRRAEVLTYVANL